MVFEAAPNVVRPPSVNSGGWARLRERLAPGARVGSCLLATLLAGATAHAAIFTVDSTADTDDATPDGTCDSAPGPAVACTLREAIREANNTIGADTILFNIPPGGLQTLAPGSAYPTLTRPVTIDGYSQGGGGYTGPPLIQIDGTLAGAAHGFTLSGATSNASTIRGLIINRFQNLAAGTAIRILNSSNNFITGNFLGTDAAGTAASPNRVGIFIQGTLATPASGNQIGGTAPGDGNVVSGNTVDGIQVNGTGANGNSFQGNHIGVDYINGTVDLGNASQGILINGGADNNTVGGLVAAARNVISGNGNDGVVIADAGTTGNLVQGNRIGTNAAGTAAIPNLRGVELSNCSGNTVGGAAGSQNLISGNGGPGIFITNCDNNTVSRNVIGLDVTGGAKIPNGGDGVLLANAASGNTIGGTGAGEGNVISGNAFNGVVMVGVGTSGNSILGNVIGLDPAGSAILGNSTFGVAIAQGASGNFIGNASGRNVISGNTLAGVRIVDDGTSNNLVQSNFIGTDASGTLPRPNLTEGVIMGAPAVATAGNRIGGVGLGNVISGNGTIGIWILDFMTGTLVQGNIIGRDPTDSFGIPNGNGGVRVQSSSGNTIGGMGAGEGNVIAGNSGSDGVAVVGATATGNAILGNSIFSNAGLGIDLGDDGVTANDVGDGDAGANSLQNTAVLSAVTTNGTSVHIAGSLSTVPGVANYRVEFFAHDSPDPTGFGEGARYLGFQNVTTDAAGNAVVAATLLATVTASVDYVTATVTHLVSNSTSEFARNRTAVGELIVTTTASAADAPDTSSIAALIANNGPDGRISLREAILATNATAGTDTIRFGIPLTDANHYYYRDDSLPGLSVVAATPGADADITDFDPHYPAGFTRSWYRIRPTAALPLPSVTGAVVIDAETQPGFIVGAPVVELDGSVAGAGSSGLSLTTGPSTVRGLVVNRFQDDGLNLRGPGGFSVTGNYLGTDVSGTQTAGNVTGSGVFITQLTGAPSTIGGSALATRNLISANGRNGVYVYNYNAPANTVAVLIRGNTIGTDVTGTVGLGVQLRGIVLEYTGGHTIGGGGAGEGNLISGNAGPGIDLNGNYDSSGGAGAATDNNVIEGNRIGTNAAGTAAIPNAGPGVQMYGLSGPSPSANGNTIRGNVIAASTTAGGHGIYVLGNADNNLYEGNFIGTDSGGTLDLGNAGSGIHIETGGALLPTGNRIQNNTIRFNGVDGVRILGTGASATLTQNRIWGNDALGIDLGGDGATLNDTFVNDADTGPNGLLNYPSSPPAVETAGTLSVNFGLDTAAGWYRVEFFKSPSGADPGGFGEGQTFASSVLVNHPGGRAAYNHSFAGIAGDVISATTTECNDGACATPGSTSEFGRAWAAVTTAVELLSFTAVGGEESVLLEWRTASELTNLGFHLYRSPSESGSWTRITASLIAGLGSSPVGATYTWRDAGLVSSQRYCYRLEDIDTASVSTFHGPACAAPSASGADGDGGGGGDGAEQSPQESCPAWVLAAQGESTSSILRCTRHGDPDSVSLQVLSRDSRQAELELRTGGFWAVHESLTSSDSGGTGPEGSAGVRLYVRGLDTPSDPKALALPLRRALVEAVVGKQVRLVSAQALDLTSFPELRPSAVGVSEMGVSRGGTARAVRRSVRASYLSRGYSPQQVARLAGTVFQGERKSAVVELVPVRYDGTRGQLVLAGRVRVRLVFAGREPGEKGSGSRGRRERRQPSLSQEVLAQLHTSRLGLHGVRFEDVFPGRARSLSTSLLRLERQGEVASFHVEPGRGVFGPGSVLYFHAERKAESTDYTREVSYELLRSREGREMGVVQAIPQGASLVKPSTGQAQFETNRLYQAGLLEAPDVWLWEALVSGASRTKEFALSGVDTGSVESSRVIVHLQGGSESGATADHHVSVTVNGSVVGETRFSGKRPYRMDVAVPASVLREGTNAITLVNAGDTGVSSLVFLDRFTVEYPQRPEAHAGVFEGEWSEDGTAEVTGLNGPAVVLDVTGAPAAEPGEVEVPRNDKWLIGVEARPGAVRFRAEAGRRYLVVSSEGVLAPRLVRPAPSTLRSAENQADYLLVAPESFLPAAERLLLRRASQGLTVKAVSLEEIATVFGHGRPSGEAIRAFVSHAYHQWKAPSPRYVVLLGDATYDPQHFVATSWPSPLPALWGKTSYLWTAMDPELAAVNGEDGLADLAIGRIPATTAEQAESLIGKLLAWEDSGQGLEGRVALVADDPDTAGDFEADAEDIRASLLSDRETRVLKVGDLGAATRPAIQEALDSGLSLLSYVGHGGSAVWASENVWNSWDAASLLAQSRQPVLLTMNCLNGYFVGSNFESLSESLLKAEGRGAVAAFSPSGLSVDGPAHQYHRAVVAELVRGRHERLGDAILAAQRTYAEAGLMPELLSIYHLLGDPAMRIR